MRASNTHGWLSAQRRCSHYFGLCGAARRRPASICFFMLALMGAFATGCDNNRTRGIVVDNRTDLELHFVVALESGPYAPLDRAHPHQSERVIPAQVLPASGCTSGGMIALADDGHEVARHDAPLCVDDIWVIDPSQMSIRPSATASP